MRRDRCLPHTQLTPKCDRYLKYRIAFKLVLLRQLEGWLWGRKDVTENNTGTFQVALPRAYRSSELGGYGIHNGWSQFRVVAVRASIVWADGVI